MMSILSILGPSAAPGLCGMNLLLLVKDQHDQYQPKVDRLCKENFANVALLLDTATKLLFINTLLP